MDNYDILIENAKVIDGTGRAAFKGSIGIKGDKIVKVGKIDPAIKSPKTIDAHGLVVCPGFIDIHSHGDETLLLYPYSENFLMQGVTTIVGGNCGFSPAPLKDWWLMSFWELDWWHELSPYKYYPDLLQPLDKVNNKVQEKHDIEMDWSNFDEYLTKVEKSGISLNYVPLVGHNNIRVAVMGEDLERAPNEEELKEMERLVTEAIEAGAFGLSTGLDYSPGCFAKTSELIKLARVAGDLGGFYATHWRRTGIRRGTRTRPQEKIKGIEEAIRIGKEAEVPVQISHLLSGYTIFPPPSSSYLTEAVANATLEVIEDAIAKGMDIAFDVIPNTDGGVFTVPYISSLLAPWLREIGSPEGLAKALAAKDFRDEVREVIEGGKWWWINPRVDPYWAQKITLINCKTKDYEGKTLAELAADKSPLDRLFDLIVENPKMRIHSGSLAKEEEVAAFLTHPKGMVCTDTFSLDDRWEVHTPPYYLPHPNTYSAYPRFLRVYVRENQDLALEEAIQKATSLPASRVGLNDRGVVREGAFADLVLFDFEQIRERGDHLEPRRYPVGIRYVLVNGEVVVKEGRHKRIREGKVIRKC